MPDHTRDLSVEPSGTEGSDASTGDDQAPVCFEIYAGKVLVEDQHLSGSTYSYASRVVVGLSPRTVFRHGPRPVPTELFWFMMAQLRKPLMDIDDRLRSGHDMEPQEWTVQVKSAMDSWLRRQGLSGQYNFHGSDRSFERTLTDGGVVLEADYNHEGDCMPRCRAFVSLSLPDEEPGLTRNRGRVVTYTSIEPGQAPDADAVLSHVNAIMRGEPQTIADTAPNWSRVDRALQMLADWSIQPERFSESDKAILSDATSDTLEDATAILAQSIKRSFDELSSRCADLRGTKLEVRSGKEVKRWYDYMSDLMWSREDYLQDQTSPTRDDTGGRE